MAFWLKNSQFQVWIQPLGWFTTGFSPIGQGSSTQIKKKTTNMDTYNPLFPWFNEEEYKKLEAMVDSKGLVGEEKTNMMNQLYQHYYPQVLNKKKLNERQQVINDSVYKNWDTLINWSNEANTGLKLANLAQMAKQKFWIPYDTSDAEVINAMVNGVQNWNNLLYDYITSNNPELLYASWIQSRPASQKEKAKQKLDWIEIWANMYVRAQEPIDAIKKRWKANLSKSAILDKLAHIWKASWANKDVMDEYIQEHQEETLDYIDKVNAEYQAKQNKFLDQDVKEYYWGKGFTELLKEWDFNGFFYKWLWDAASNWDMPLIIAATAVQPEMGFALMATDTYARESQEAFEQMLANWASYEEAEKWWVVVWVINAAVEVWLEKLIGWVETWAANAIRNSFMKNVQEEAVKKWLGRILLETAWWQIKASAEEWLEEVVQQIVQNAYVKTVNENKDVLEWVWEAFEWWFYNPMNLLAGGSNLTTNLNQNSANIQQDFSKISNEIKSMPSDVWDKTKNLPTRKTPEWLVENEMKLTPKERERVERTWISAWNFVLSENLAGLSNEDKINALEQIATESYNKKTEMWKQIPDTERVSSKDAHKMINLMIKSIEKSDIMSEEYGDYVNALKQFANKDSYTFAEWLALIRDFDQLKWSHIFNKQWETSNFEKSTIAKWRAWLNTELDNIWDKYGFDLKKESSRISNAITIRDGLLRSISQKKKNNYLWLTDIWLWAIMSSWNPVETAVWIVGKKAAESMAWKVAQKLYNLNSEELAPLDGKRWASFINKNNNNGGNDFRLNYLTDMTTTADKQAWTQVIDNILDVDVWASPLDTIRDADVWNNPMTETTDNSKRAGKTKSKEKVKWYWDDAYRPSIMMKTDGYGTDTSNNAKKTVYKKAWEKFTWTHWYWYYMNTTENEILSEIHDNGGANYNGIVREVDIPEQTSKDTPTWNNYFVEDYERSKADVDRLLKSITETDKKLWETAKDTTILGNLSKYEKVPWHKIYNTLSQIFGWPVKASDFLNKIWYDGIIYTNNYWEQYVIFNKDSMDTKRSYWYNEDRWLRSKGGTVAIQEWFITSKPTDTNFIDEEWNWISKYNNKDTDNIIKVTYHPDWYLTLKVPDRTLNSDEIVWIQGFENEPIKRIDITIYDPQTWKAKSMAEYETIQDALDFVTKDWNSTETNKTSSTQLFWEVTDSLLKKWNDWKEIRVWFMKNGNPSWTHTIRKFYADWQAYYSIDNGTSNNRILDAKEMKDYLNENTQIHYLKDWEQVKTTEEWDNYENKTEEQKMKNPEYRATKEKENSRKENLRSKIWDKNTIKEFKEYFDGELKLEWEYKNRWAKWDMYRDVLEFLEWKRDVKDFHDTYYSINDLPTSDTNKIYDLLWLRVTSIQELHNNIKKYWEWLISKKNK